MELHKGQSEANYVVICTCQPVAEGAVMSDPHCPMHGGPPATTLTTSHVPPVPYVFDITIRVVPASDDDRDIFGPVLTKRLRTSNDSTDSAVFAVERGVRSIKKFMEVGS